MKTIEERCKSYMDTLGAECFQPENIESTLKNIFIAGAESEHEELVKWHDPKDLPPQRKVVLLKYNIRIKEGKEYKERTICRTGYYIFDEYVCHDRCMDLYQVKGWREIHE